MTRGQYARRFIHQVGARHTDENVLAVVCWMQAEGGQAKNNPLNTTLYRPGSTDYNWVGVKNYPTVDVGIEASAYTLNYGADRFRYGYRPIRRRIRKGRNAERILKAVEASEWGTGGLALDVLADVREGRQKVEHLKSIYVAGSV